MVDTIIGALEVVAERSERDEAFSNPLIWGGPDLADPKCEPTPGTTLRGLRMS